MVLIDSCPEDGYYFTSIYGADNWAAGQYIPPRDKNYKVTSVKFKIRKKGSPTGNMHARIYASVHAGYPDCHTATGDVLASSDTKDVAALGTEYSIEEFFFTGANQIILDKDTGYCIVLFYDGGNSGNCVQNAENRGNPHAGNEAHHYTYWSCFENYDIPFWLYGDPLGWSGKVCGVVNPAKVMGVAVANIAKVKGVA